MALNWVTVNTEGYFRFEASLVSKSPYRFVITDSNSNRGASLTNAMESVLAHLIIGVGPELCRDMQVYQWCPGEGVFQVHWMLSHKITRDMHPWAVTDVKWHKIADDLKAFEVLYG